MNIHRNNKRKTKRFLLFLAALIVLSFFTGCSNTNNKPETEEETGTTESAVAIYAGKYVLEGSDYPELRMFDDGSFILMLSKDTERSGKFKQEGSSLKMKTSVGEPFVLQPSGTDKLILMTPVAEKEEEETTLPEVFKNILNKNDVFVMVEAATAASKEDETNTSDTIENTTAAQDSSEESSSEEMSNTEV